MDRFRDRRHAGGLLARALASYAGGTDVVGVPDYEEFAMGAIASGGMVVAAPVATPRVCNDLRWHVDDMACLLAPDDMRAVADWYDDFPQVTDARVRELLDDNRLRIAPAEGRAGAQLTHPS